MSRPLRHTYPGAIYHIINRGSRKENIFRRTRDRKEFLSRIQKAAEKFDVIIHGYCLMDNHFHLLVQTMQDNISQFMQNSQAGYANWFRAKYGQIGPLFQSRYKSVLVEDESYLLTLSCYIHLNPVRAGMVDNAVDYKWSSCSIYLAGTESELIDQKTVLFYAGGIENYKYILAGMSNELPEKEAIYGKYSLLGKDAFREKISRQEGVQMANVDFVAQPEYRALSRRNPEAVRKIVMKEFRISKKNLIAKKHNNIARKIYGLLLKRETLLKIRDIGDLLDMTYHGAGSFIIRFERDVEQSSKLQGIVDEIKSKLYGE